jgi:tight adherence protein C
MLVLAAATGAGASVVLATWPFRPRPVATLGSMKPARTSSLAVIVGMRLLRAARRPDPDPASARRAGRCAIAVAIVVPVLPLLAPAVVAGTWLHARMLRIRAARALGDEVTRGLPEAVDLLGLCCGAGLALPLAHPLVADHLPPPIGPALLAAHRSAEAGTPRSDALVAELSRLGPRAAALAHLLAEHLRYGIALAPGLERLGLELRLERRRQAEQDARRVPVRLLGPLVTCVLPAFCLLTVVPLLAASLRSLPT